MRDRPNAAGDAEIGEPAPHTLSTPAAAADFYDRLWLDEWRDMEVHNPTARHLQRFISRTLGRLGDIRTLLDVGCGIGINLKAIRQDHPQLRLFGTDLSPKITGLARDFVHHDPAISFHVLDIATDRLGEMFDVVLCNQVLEHIENDADAMRNLAAMCREYLVITVPGGRYNSTSRLVGHFRHYSRAQLVELVRPTGFDILSVREWGFPFHSLYKLALGSLPAEVQRKLGFGRYGGLKKLVSAAIYLLYFANVVDAGANVLLVARRARSPAAATAEVTTPRSG